MSGSDSLLSIVPTREELDALLLGRQGDLRDRPYRLLLLALAVREKSALLTLRRGPLEKEIVFDAGAAVDCNSNIATETLGRFLVSSGRLSERDHQAALSASAARGADIEDVLTERQLIAPTELYRALQQNLGRKLLEPFSWTSGSWTISYDVPPVESALRVRIPQLIVTGIAKVEPLETIEAVMDAAGATRISLGTAPLLEPSELRLSAIQQRVMDQFRQGLALDDLRRSAQGSEDLDRFVFALLLMGVAAPSPAAAAASAPPISAIHDAVPFFELDLPEAPAPQIPPPKEPVAAAPPPPAADAASSEEVMAAYLTFRRRDAFDLLGLDPAAGPGQIVRSFVRLAERFLPSRFAASEGLPEKAQEVFLAVARAYAELADPTKRQALIDRRSHKPGPAPEKTAGPAPPPRAAPAPPRRVVIDPEELHRQGRAAAAAGRLREALGSFEMAADCDAQNGTYAAEVAYCRFQLMISPAAVALKSLKNAIRIDPRCAVAYLYAAKVQETLGNTIEAQAYRGRAASLMPRGDG